MDRATSDATRTTVDTGAPGPAVVPPEGSAFARGAPGFEAEVNAHLQDRLRFGTGFMGLASLVLFVVGRAMNRWSGKDLSVDLLDPASLTHLAATGLALACWAILRGRALSGAALRAADLVVVESTVVACLGIYASSYTLGILQLVPFLGLFLVARSVVVPSRAGRTLLLSFWALPGVLAVQLAHGVAYARGGARIEGEGFAALVVWDQMVLALSVAIATVTSRVNFGLRARAWEASQVDRYTLEEKIGEGAMGEVYRARHGLLRRPTAVKVLRPEIAGEKTLRRFEHEVRQTARLSHPSTIAIYDYGQTGDGVFYYAMELLDGVDLDRAVVAAGPMPAARVIHLLSQACAALHEAHGIGLVHRDVKPANLILCRRAGELDVLKVMDFGLVKDTAGDAGLSVAGELCGTPLTVAPESLRGQPAAPAVDIYALAAVGCFLLTGRPIFEAASAAEFLVCHLNAAPVPPSRRVASVPADLEAVLLRSLAKDPAARHASTEAFRESLAACADAGRWTREDARRWWDEWGGRLVKAPAAA